MCGRDGRIRLHIFLMDFCWFFCNNNVAYQMFFQVLFGRFDMESEKGKAVNVTPTKPTLCEDGKYRWMYEINMYTNPVIFLSVVKVLLISAAVVICLWTTTALFTGRWTSSSRRRRPLTGFWQLSAPRQGICRLPVLVFPIPSGTAWCPNGAM